MRVTESTNIANINRLVELMARYVHPAAVRTVLDLGSRDGEVALAFEKVFGNADVYAFECNPEAIPLCREALTGSRVTLQECAVSHIDGTVPFFPIDRARTKTPHADGNIGASSMFRANPAYPHEAHVQREILVPSVRLDSWATARGIEAIDLVWMDLQGAELLALEGLGGRIEAIPFIYTEIEFKEMYLGQPLLRDVSSFMSSHGFRLEEWFSSWEWAGDALFINPTAVQAEPA